MALSIERSTTLKKMGDSFTKRRFAANRNKHNSWLVEHLRQLADKIEEENPRAINIGLRTDCQYKCPKLYLELYER